VGKGWWVESGMEVGGFLIHLLAIGIGFGPSECMVRIYIYITVIG
jgi:hypothetical protein